MLKFSSYYFDIEYPYGYNAYIQIGVYVSHKEGVLCRGSKKNWHGAALKKTSRF